MITFNLEDKIPRFRLIDFKSAKGSCRVCAGSKMCKSHIRLEKYIGMVFSELDQNFLKKNGVNISKYKELEKIYQKQCFLAKISYLISKDTDENHILYEIKTRVKQNLELTDTHKSLLHSLFDKFDIDES